jgi:hypothetical protein
MLIGLDKKIHASITFTIALGFRPRLIQGSILGPNQTKPYQIRGDWARFEHGVCWNKVNISDTVTSDCEKGTVW